HRSEPPTEGHKPSGILHEVERLLHRFRALIVATPALLLVGYGAGQATRVAFSVSEGQSVLPRAERTTPYVHLDALSLRMQAMSRKGEKTLDLLETYLADVEPVERVLRSRGVSHEIAKQISWPLIRESQLKGLDPATVVAILMVESGGKRTARSSVGARGLMQVMPAWAGHWRGCGRDLYDVEDNLCNGTSILRWYKQQHGKDERKALLGYNGCVRGTNTPNCFEYPEKVWRLRNQIKREISRERERIADDALN
ncbi:MAG: lytic transglycosylase domain-containing protein, partial [Longimicrobiales bacterium]